MNLLHEIEVGENAPNEVNVVVENCKGSSNKIEYDKNRCVFKLDRVLYSPVYWPFEYGFIPQTWEEDDDPLDVVVLITNPTFPGCVIKVRPIGVLKMEDEKGMDNKIIAVAVDDPRFNYIKDVKELPEHTKKEMVNFFEVYKSLEPNKWVKVKGWLGAKEAKELIKKANKLFEEKFNE